MASISRASFAILALSDGSVFKGFSKGYSRARQDCCTVGEVVFNTAMTGYQEILTDPSYHSQLINFTHPHIGNVGINTLDEEADTIYAAGIIARRISDHYSNWRAAESLPAYLRKRKILAIDGVDTRAITQRLRDHGALGGCLFVPAGGDTDAAAAAALKQAKEFSGLSGQRLAPAASCRKPLAWKKGEWRQADNQYAAPTAPQRRVTVLDCGVKKNILRALTQRGCRVQLLPYDSSYEAVLKTRPDGVLLSNGPGDPAPCDNARVLAKKLLAEPIPLFGLCLGHQIVALALGAKTEKMKFGHHGANHPVQCLADGRVLITSQNHGFAVRADSLPPAVKVAYRSLFDGSLQGVAAESPPLLTFQGHPEASPGPKEAAVLFDRFIDMIDRWRHA